MRDGDVANLQTAFAIPTKARLEDELRGVGDASALTTDQYNTHFGRLRAYLEACDIEHLETEWEPAALTEGWGRALNANQKADKDVLKAHVVKEIGAIARPDEIRFTDALPKTRSGKIMRRLLKEIAATGVARGDVTTLEDMNVLDRLSSSAGDDE